MTDIREDIRRLLKKHRISQRAFSEIILGIENPAGPESMSTKEKNRHYDNLKKHIQRNSAALSGYYDILIDHLSNVAGTQTTIVQEIQKSYRSSIPTDIELVARQTGQKIRKLAESKNSEQS